MHKLMIVDDEYYFRQGLKQLIRWEDFGLEIGGEAKNGQEALGLIDELQPDALLLDINMPVMDGLRLLSELRARGNLMPVLLLTGYGEFEYAQQALRLGARDYLLKPVTAPELAQAAEKLREALVKSAPREGCSPETHGRTAAHSLSDKAMAYVDSHYAEADLSEGRIARALYVNPSHLSAMFSKATGRTLIQYLFDVRMKNARRIIDEGNCVILSVAELTGYGDANYFGKCFKRHTGFTPSQYINRKK